jgi:hypothetical protein
MNVTVLDTAASTAKAGAVRRHEPEDGSQVAEWIDPEGNDWFAVIYRELAGQSEAVQRTDQPMPELEDWFG